MEERKGVLSGGDGLVVGTEPMPDVVGSVGVAGGGKLKIGKGFSKPNSEPGPNFEQRHCPPIALRSGGGGP